MEKLYDNVLDFQKISPSLYTMTARGAAAVPSYPPDTIHREPNVLSVQCVACFFHRTNLFFIHIGLARPINTFNPMLQILIPGGGI